MGASMMFCVMLSCAAVCTAGGRSPLSALATVAATPAARTRIPARPRLNWAMERLQCGEARNSIRGASRMARGLRSAAVENARPHARALARIGLRFRWHQMQTYARERTRMDGRIIAQGGGD